MPVAYWYCLPLLLSAAGCGRVGVRLLLLDGDAGVERMDAGVPPLAGRAGVGGEAGSGAGRGGAFEPGADAGPLYEGPDAATGMPAAGSAADAGNPPSCGGALQFELCWYLAAEDTSCSSECANKGGFDNRALAVIGTPNQGGSESECAAVLGALGLPSNAASGTQSIGLGCHLWSNGDRWWLVSPDFSATAATPQDTRVRIACACRR